MAKRRTKKVKLLVAKRRAKSIVKNEVHESEVAKSTLGGLKYVFDESVFGENAREKKVDGRKGEKTEVARAESLLAYDPSLLLKDLRKTVLLSLVVGAILALFVYLK